MSSGGALTMSAIVPEYVGSTMRLSPDMTRFRSDGVVPQRAIQRRTGNQYSAANVRKTRSVGNMALSCCLAHGENYATERSVVAARSSVRKWSTIVWPMPAPLGDHGGG